MKRCGQFKTCPSTGEMMRTYQSMPIAEARVITPEEIIDPTAETYLTSVAKIIDGITADATAKLAYNPNDRTVFCGKPFERRVGTLCIQICPFNPLAKILRSTGIVKTNQEGTLDGR